MGREDSSRPVGLIRCWAYLPVLTYWMQSPWRVKIEPSAHVKPCQPSFLQARYSAW